jgi:hypothetical protein
MNLDSCCLERESLNEKLSDSPLAKEVEGKTFDKSLEEYDESLGQDDEIDQSVEDENMHGDTEQESMKFRIKNIAVAEERHGRVFARDDRGRLLFDRPGQLHGYTGSTLTVRRNNFLFGYDVNGRHTFTRPNR